VDGHHHHCCCCCSCCHAFRKQRPSAAV
jgi:hypothetical protein